MKIVFTKAFKKAVKARPQGWQDPETILSEKKHEVPAEIKINGLLYKLGEEVEIVGD